MRQRALQVAPEAGHVTQVLRLAIAAVEPGEYAEDFCRPLCRQSRIDACEAGSVETPVAAEPATHIATKQGHFHPLRDIDARVLKQRGDVIGGWPDQGVLKIEQADPRDVVTRRQP